MGQYSSKYGCSGANNNLWYDISRVNGQLSLNVNYRFKITVDSTNVYFEIYNLDTDTLVWSYTKSETLDFSNGYFIGALSSDTGKMQFKNFKLSN